MFNMDKNNSLNRSLTLLWLVPVILISLILGVYIITQRLTDIEDTLIQKQISILRYIASSSELAMYSGDFQRLEEISKSIPTNQDIEGIAFYNPKLKLVNSSRGFTPDISELDKFLLTPPETLIKEKNNWLMYKPIINNSIEIEDDFVQANLEADNLLGYVFVYSAKNYLISKRKEIIFTSIIICITGILITLAFSRRLNSKINQSISLISKSINELSHGNFNYKIEEKEGELSKLYGDLNSLSNTLKHHDALMKQNIEIAVRKKQEALETVEQKNLELSIQKEKAEQANKTKDEFLAKMSHELRTPVNAINGFANLIKKKSQTIEETEHANIIINSSNVLLSIINELLDFSKIELGELEVSETEFDLIRCIDNVCQMNYGATEERNIDFNIDIDPDLARYVIGDEYKLTQILNNILSNAIKFTSKGHVHFDIKLKNKSFQYQTIKFTISDTGVGIPNEKLSVIFDEFTQLKTNIDAYNEGTGLGLSIVKKLVSLLNGSIDISSELNKGTVVTLTVPLDTISKISLADAKSNQLDPKNIIPEQVDDLKILISEDHDFNRLLLINILGEYNFETYETKNGEELLEFLPKVEPDIVLLDLHMPVMDGYTVCKKIRSRTDKLKGTPILIMTADVISLTNAKFLETQANDIIYKPIQAEELIEKIVVNSRLKLNTLNTISKQISESSYTRDELYNEYKRLIDMSINQNKSDDKNLKETLHMLRGIASLTDNKILANKIKSLNATSKKNLDKNLNEIKKIIDSDLTFFH